MSFAAPELMRRWYAGARLAWPLILSVAVLAAGAGYTIAPTIGAPLSPEFAFENTTETIAASGAWRSVGSNIPNAAEIFCWFPVNSCQLIVAQLIPEGRHLRLKIVNKELDIVQLSDATLTATASSTDPCKAETLRIDRQAQTATLTVGPSNSSTCSGVQTFTATLGR